MAASMIIAVLGLASSLLSELVVQERPALVVAGITTRSLAGSGTVRAHPTHVETASYRIDTQCRDNYCVEELRANGRVLIAASAALGALRREVSAPDHERDTDATEVVLPQPSAPGFLSVYRLESDYTTGAAHARNSLRCETYRTSTGKLVTLQDVVGVRAAHRIAIAARAALGQAEATAYGVGTTSLLVPTAGTVVLCGDADRVGARSPITIQVNVYHASVEIAPSVAARPRLLALPGRASPPD